MKMLWQQPWQNTVQYRCASIVVTVRVVIGKTTTGAFSKAAAKPRQALWTIVCNWSDMIRLPQSHIGKCGTAGQRHGAKKALSACRMGTAMNAALDVRQSSFPRL